eukprot:3311845-Rhodomonas_salina.1
MVLGCGKGDVKRERGARVRGVLVDGKDCGASLRSGKQEERDAVGKRKERKCTDSREQGCEGRGEIVGCSRKQREAALAAKQRKEIGWTPVP